MLPSITTGLQKTNGGKGRPLEFIMLPIIELAEILGQEIASDRIFQAVEENLTHEIQAIFDECDHLRTIIHTIYTSIQKVEDFFQEDEINQVTFHEQSSVRIAREIRSRIGKMLVRVRSTNAESSELDQLLVELESKIATLRSETKQLERGDVNAKIQYALELKDKGVIPVREPDSLAIIQNRHPKHQIFVLYTSNELRRSSKEKWVTVYFEFLHRIEANFNGPSRNLFCYFDYDLHPNFQPQSKKLEVREYVGASVMFSAARGRPEMTNGTSGASGIDSLVRNGIV
jgi:translation initiation factor 1 (eIF-1/SUI1)